MRRTFRFRHRSRVEPPRYRINQFITVPEVRVVDEQGVNLGVLPTPKAIALAAERGLDLLEVSPKAVPPVCRIESYGSFKYREAKEKQKAKQKQKKVEVKGVRISLNIGAHDRDVRLAKAQEFFGEGHRVQVEMVLRGRERQHTDLAKKAMNDFVQALGDGVDVEQPISVQGGRLSMVVCRKS